MYPSLCGTLCALCLHSAVNKPTCRTGWGLMFQLEASTNRPKWMRENGSDSKQVPRGHEAKTFLNIFQSWSWAVPEHQKLCVCACVYFPSLANKIRLLLDPLASQRDNASMISFPKPLTGIPVRSAYTDLNSASAESSHELQHGEFTVERASEISECLKYSYITDWVVVVGGQVAAFSLLYKHWEQRSSLAFLGRDASVQSGAENTTHAAWEKGRASHGQGCWGRKRRNQPAD